jgi:hypothetical protein
MWIPRWFKWLSDSLRSETGAIQQAIKQQEIAISVNSKSANDERREAARMIASAIDKAASSASSSEHAQRDKEYRLQRALVVLTFIAAGGAVAAAIGSWLALPQVKKSADAATSAADTAQNTLSQSIDAFRIDERAWVEIEPIKPTLLDISPTFGATYTCDLYLKNEGKTAASNIRIRATDALSVGGWDKHPDVVRRTQDNIPLEIADSSAPRVLAPGTTATAPFRLTCQAPQYFKNGMAAHYLIGRIDYCDQFRVKHSLRFCYFVVNARGEIWNCQEGNDEDHNPERTPDKSCPED